MPYNSNTNSHIWYAFSKPGTLVATRLRQSLGRCETERRYDIVNQFGEEQEVTGANKKLLDLFHGHNCSAWLGRVTLLLDVQICKRVCMMSELKGHGLVPLLGWRGGCAHLPNQHKPIRAIQPDKSGVRRGNLSTYEVPRYKGMVTTGQ
jgi:hypothetical protein